MFARGLCIRLKLSNLVRTTRSLYSLTDVKEEFSVFPGGNVDLNIQKESGVATITLQHAEKKNAISGHMMGQLLDIVEQLENWTSGKGLLIKSEGDYFCSGGDLQTVKGLLSREKAEKMSFLMHCITTRISKLPLISVAIINGPALGGGAELTTVSDYRIFSPTGKVGFVQAKMGVITGWAGGTRLIQLVGHRMAMELMLTCKIINSTDAYNIGLADHITTGKDVYKEGLEWLLTRINHSPHVIAAIKRTVVAGRDLTAAMSLGEEKENFIPLWGGDLHQSALMSKKKHK